MNPTSRFLMASFSRHYNALEKRGTSIKCVGNCPFTRCFPGSDCTHGRLQGDLNYIYCCCSLLIAVCSGRINTVDTDGSHPTTAESIAKEINVSGDIYIRQTHFEWTQRQLCYSFMLIDALTFFHSETTLFHCL